MYKLISSGLGIGYIPKGGGTVASAVCCLAIYLALPAGEQFGLLSSVSITIILFTLGLLSSYKVEAAWGKDNYRVVIDEIAGMWVSMLFIPQTLVLLVTGFILFRFFDIVKPLYIRRMESLAGGTGVMMDDVLAGVYTNLILQIALAYNLF